MQFRFILIITLVWIIAPAAGAQDQSMELPATFTGNRIFLQPVTERGDTLNLLADTGGALILAKNSVSNLKLPTELIEIRSRVVKVSPLPSFKPDASIPAPPLKKANQDAPSVQESLDLLKRRMFVYSLSESMRSYIGEGVLGQDWFATRIWTFDYPGQKMILHNSFDEQKTPANHKVRIYFKEDSEGQHQMHFPRIQAVVDGDTLNFLLKTGATLVLKDMVQLALNDGMPQARGASFITRTQFEEWYFEHPEWKIYEDVEKDRSSNMIRVPEVTIAGHTVGPVWFTTRPDNMFYKEMPRHMDHKIDGALGGSLLKYFSITVHYPKEYAVFELVDN